MSQSKGSIALAALTTLGLASAAYGGTFYTVAVIGQSMPGDSGQTFGTFSNNPGLGTDGNDVVFIGAPNFNYGTNALYDYNIASQSLNLIALSSSTGSPDGSNFSNVGFPAVSNGVISFNAQTANNPSDGGIYTYSISSGSFATVADTSTTIPGSSPTAKFGTIKNIPSMNGSNVIMEGGPSGNSSSGIYVSNSGGPLTKIIDDNSASPGGGQYGTFNNAMISGNTISYMSSHSSNTGVYTASSNGTNANFIAGNGSAAPGGGTYGTLDSLILNDGSHVLFGGETTANGLFMYPVGGGAGIAIVSPANTTPIPGEPGAFFNGLTAVQGYAISDGIVAFDGSSTTNNYYGIYEYNVSTGTYSKVVAEGDTVDGHVLTDAELIDASIANGIDEYAFIGTWTGGEGIFVDPVNAPEPSSLALLGLGSLLILRRRRSMIAPA